MLDIEIRSCTLRPMPDFTIILSTDEGSTRLLLSSFLADNELDAEIVAELRGLPEGQTYRDGGGAGEEWSVTRVYGEPS